MRFESARSSASGDKGRPEFHRPRSSWLCWAGKPLLEPKLFKAVKLGYIHQKKLRNRVELYKYILYNHSSKNYRRTQSCKLLWFWQISVVFLQLRTILSSLVPADSWPLKTENIIWKIGKYSYSLNSFAILWFINIHVARRQMDFALPLWLFPCKLNPRANLNMSVSRKKTHKWPLIFPAVMIISRERYK